MGQGANVQSLTESIQPAAYTPLERRGSHKGGPVDTHPDNTKPCVKHNLKTQSTNNLGLWNEVLPNKIHFPAYFIFFRN